MRAGFRRARLAPLLAAGALCLGAERPPGLRDVRTIRHWSYPEFTRVVVELSGATRARLHRLPSDPSAKRPERLYLDLEGVWVGRRYPEPIPVGDGLLEGVRAGQNTLTTARVVIDLERYQRHRLLELSQPDRIVVDVFGPRDGPRARGPEPELRSADPATRLPLDMRPVRTVVVDAGHGGRDPGALGAGGLREKDVTLRLSRMLRDRLRERGFRVVMTRESDRTLDLEERTAIAEGAGGDVFVSIHVNAAPRRQLAGIETYYLDQGYERHSVHVAARENGISPRQVDALQRTVAQLRVSEASGHSALLAQLVHRDLVKGLRARDSRVRDLGVKKGPFYVLFLASMPSILVETGFLTNSEDARRLRDPGYLNTVAERIAAGLVSYRDRMAPVVARSGE